MCGQWGEGGWARKLPKEVISKGLPIEQLEIFIDDISSFKPAITLFGGEPFLYPDWENLVYYIKSKGLRVNVITNGTLISRNVKKIVDRTINTF